MPVFNPSPPQAAPIVTLFVFVLIACAVILALVSSLVVYACLRYRRKPGQGEPPQRSANEIHPPSGKNLGVLIKTNDVIHDFGVPQLARKVDAIPGFPNYLLLHADKPGVYLGACSEFCGEEHTWMRFHVAVNSASDFEAWKRARVQPACTAGGLDHRGANNHTHSERR
jgi:heme/copper-type cytochrome/quinol oxidase subunit 2